MVDADARRACVPPVVCSGTLAITRREKSASGFFVYALMLLGGDLVSKTRWKSSIFLAHANFGGGMNKAIESASRVKSKSWGATMQNKCGSLLRKRRKRPYQKATRRLGKATCEQEE